MERRFDYTDEGEYLYKIHKLAKYNEEQIDGMVEHICCKISDVTERKELLTMINKLRAFADPQFIDMCCALDLAREREAKVKEEPLTLGTL